MPKPQAVAKISRTDTVNLPGWRAVLLCTVCARHFVVPDADADEVRFCPWCGATE